MNVDTEIEAVALKITTLRARIRWLRSNRKKLAALPEGSLFDGQLDFDNLKHPEIVKVVRTLGGKWKKTPNGTNKERIDYQTEIAGVTVRCWSGEPPPSCRIVEVEEVIPAHTIPAVEVPERRVKIRKMVCAPELAGNIALARDKAGESLKVDAP